MNSDKKNIDKLFENVLKGYKEKPSSHAWNRINQDLNGLKSKRKAVLLKWVAAAVLILFAFGSGYFYAVYNISNETVAINDKLPIENNENLSENENIANVGLEELTDKKIDELLDDNSKTRTPEDKLIFATTNFENEISEGIIPEKDEDAISTFDGIIAVNENPSKSNPIPDDSLTSVQVLPEEKSAFTHSESIVTNSVDEVIPTLNEIANEDFFDKSGIPRGFNNKNAFDSKWGVGARIAPIQSYREISFANEGTFTQGVIDESNYNDIEGKLNSYAGGLDVRYQISNKWSLQSGVYFSRIGQINNDALAFKQENDGFVLFSITTSTGEIDVIYERVPEDIKNITGSKDTSDINLAQDVTIRQTFDLFEIPFMVGYKIGKRKFSINLSGGLSPAYVVNNNSTLLVNEQEHNIGSSRNINSMIINSSFSLGMEYAFNRKLAFNFEPMFKYSLNPINKNNQFNYHPYSLSWFTGVRYRF